MIAIIFKNTFLQNFIMEVSLIAIFKNDMIYIYKWIKNLDSKHKILKIYNEHIEGKNSLIVTRRSAYQQETYKNPLKKRRAAKR